MKNVVAVISCLLVVSCVSHRQASRRHEAPRLQMYAVQVGAFSNASNAAAYTASLRERSIDAYHFLHESGLYKVRIGNFKAKATAQSYADQLKQDGIIDEYFHNSTAIHTARHLLHWKIFAQ